jgi:hypothetical protein
MDLADVKLLPPEKTLAVTLSPSNQNGVSLFAVFPYDKAKPASAPSEESKMVFRLDAVGLSIETTANAP